MYRCSDNLNGCLSVSANRIDKRINVAVKPIERRIVVTCSLVCTINKSAYLNVNPNYVWLTPDMLSSGEFDIISNVSWNIV